MNFNQSIQKCINSSNFFIKGSNHDDQYQEVLIGIRYIKGVDLVPIITQVFCNDFVSFVETHATKKDKPIILNNELAAQIFEDSFDYIPEDTYESVVNVLLELRDKGQFHMRYWKVIQYN